MNTDNPQPLSQKDSTTALIKRVNQALIDDGCDLSAVTPDQLVGLDQFHLRGKQATIELADLLNPSKGDKVLDMGAGVGGAARYLVERFDCQVVGLELNPAFTELAKYLNQLTGLSQRLEFVTGDAQQPPFETASFDHIWLQHLSMYLADKDAFFTTLARLIKPGGSLVMQEVVTGEGGALLLPVPWADQPQNNHIATLEQLNRAFANAGLKVQRCENRTDAAIAWIERQLGRRTSASEQSSPKRRFATHLGLLLGEQFAAMMANQWRNFAERRTELVELKLYKP